MRMPLFRGAKRWPVVVIGMLLSSILLAACGENSPSILNTAGPVASSESGVFTVILIIATIIFVAVEGILVFSIIRFRERPGTPTPRQLHGNTKVEVAWTVVPALVLFIVLGYTIRGLFEVATPPNDPGQQTMQVTAFAHQWWWEFYYPEYNVTTADSLVVPVNTVVNVHLYSNNVIHSFWVPQLTGKTDVIPGHDNMRWFKADVPNKTYLGICAEYCGTQHGNMRFNVVVDESNNFLSWVHTQQQAAVTPTNASLAAQGESVFKSAGCTACHGIMGVDLNKEVNPNPTCDAINAGAAQGCLVGPNLTHFGSRNFIAGGVLDNNTAQCQDLNNLQDCNLAKWLHDPQGIKPGNDMAIGPLTNDQVKQLVAYLESLK